MHEELQAYAREIGSELKEKNGLYEISKTIAERKAFLSKKKLCYHAKFRVDDNSKSVVFSEYLKEKGSGISSGGGDFDSDMSPGFGFKATSYKSGPGGRSGSIEEQSKLFGKDYTYEFQYQTVREKIESMAEAAGYSFEYKVLPIGL
jgi:hypothetical protein